MGVGIVLASRSPIIKRGEFVSGYFGWQQFANVSGSELIKLPSYENPQLYLGVLGISGLTAYFSVFNVARAKPSDVMVVSTAAGSVGALVCQMGKMVGCKVYGIVGCDEKGEYLKRELAVDGFVNYKNQKNLAGAIRKMCPKGVDVFVDHVGGPILDAVLANITKGARIIMSGAISSYSQKKAPPIFNYA
jgi:NADPH-dependent curcumin reductase CurA